MKIYVVTTGENEITVSLNGEAAVTKTVKPTLTALGNGRIRFVCDDIDEEVETYLNIFINGAALKGTWIAEEDYLAVSLFDAVMNKTFVSSGEGGGGSGYLVASVTLTDAQIKALPTTPIEIVAAPGAGKIINVLSVAVTAHIVTVYSNAGTVNGYMVYGTTISDEPAIGLVFNIQIITDLYDVPGDFVSLVTSTLQLDFGDAALIDKPISYIVDNTLGDFTGGNAANTLKVTVYYVVVDL